MSAAAAPVPPLGFRLYAITDPALCAPDLIQAVSEAVEGGAGAVQLRDKGASSLELFRQAERLRRLTERLGVPLVVNDRVDVALAVGADGVHLGQDDLPAARARAIWPAPRLLGVSAASAELARLAEADGADYVGVGPAFVSPTKRDARATLGPEGLAGVVRAVRIPVVAIGGIDAGNVAALARTGVAAVAVVAGLFADPRGPREAARAILHAFSTPSSPKD